MDRSRRDLLKLLGCSAAACPLLCGGGARAAAGVPHRAAYWQPLDGKGIRCTLCPRRCEVPVGERGICGVRENRDGTYYTLVHSNPCAINNDPIEKKPLFHYRPGSMSFSIATVGCNIECRFCQNWEISQFRPEQVRSRRVGPEQVVRHAERLGSRSIAFTYSEPTVFYEYMRDVCLAAAGTDIGRVLISNGYINRRPQLELLPLLDAVKIDFKAFSESFYRDVCSAHLRPVLDSLVRVREQGTWLEMVMLVIPTLNDDPRQLEAMCRWIVQKLGPEVPLHFTRFRPMYKILNLPPTPVSTLERAREIALGAGLRFAYAGNVPGHAGENTRCPSCDALLIERDGWRIARNAITDGRCSNCKKPVPGIWS